LKGEISFFDCIANIPSSEVREFIFDEIIDGMRKRWCAWKVETIFRFWEFIAEKTLAIFLPTLQFLLSSSSNYYDLFRFPLEFRKFLLEGYDLLSARHGTEILGDRLVYNAGGQQRSILINLLNLRDNKITIPLRDACLEVSRPLSNNNVSFASWWLVDELAYTRREILSKDYAELLKLYRTNIQLNLSKNDSRALFLLSGGRLGGKLSLIDCCRFYSEEKPQKLLNKILFTTVLHIWLEQNISIPTPDIAYLINRLPKRSLVLL